MKQSLRAAGTNAVKSALQRRGLSLGRAVETEYPPEVRATIELVRPYTMTSVERIEAVCSATEHILRYDIPGAFVEAGVWRGGSAMAAAATLVRHGAADRDFVLYDTYEGIPAPGAEDALIGSDHASMMRWWEKENRDPAGEAWLTATVEEVRANMGLTGYDLSRVDLVAGLVEDTVPATAPDQIALLRLDTDWYSSTKVELEVMFPRLSPGGILIIDDYGFTTGARKAVDDYLAAYPHPVYLHRIDSCGVLAVKPGVAT